MNLFKSEGFS
jgi:ribosomal protein S7